MSVRYWLLGLGREPRRVKILAGTGAAVLIATATVALASGGLPGSGGPSAARRTAPPSSERHPTTTEAATTTTAVPTTPEPATSKRPLTTTTRPAAVQPPGPPLFATSSPSGSISLNGFNIKNNCWDTPENPGPQTMYVYAWNRWSVTSDQAGSTAIKCYPSIQYLTNNQTVGSFSAITSTYSFTSPQGPGIMWDEAYDIWSNGVGGAAWQNEIMIWNDSTGQPFPYAGSNARPVTVGGVHYYYWSKGPDYHAIQLADPRQSGSVNLLACLRFFESQGIIDPATQMQSIEYGVEVSLTGGSSQAFRLDSYSLSVS